MSANYALLEEQLAALHMAAAREQYRPLAQEAAQGNWSYEAYLAKLIALETERRTRNRHTRRIKDAKFPLLKELADFDFQAIPRLNNRQIGALAEGAYLAVAAPVIMVGNPGLGKTHIAIGLGLAACRQGHRARFYTVTQLVNELSQAQSEHQLPRLLEKLGRHKLLILDEFGYVPFSPTGAQLLFQCCSALVVSMLLRLNGAGLVNCHHQPPVQRMGHRARGRKINDWLIGPADVSQPYSGVCGRIVPVGSAAPGRRSREVTLFLLIK